jgi:hypothetical protein
MRLKIVEERPRILSNRAKIHCLATSSQEEQLVKLLKQDGTRLMNGAQDGLSCVSQLAEEIADSPRALGIETTIPISTSKNLRRTVLPGWFIQEQ